MTTEARKALADRITSEIEYLGDWQTLGIKLSAVEWETVTAALRSTPEALSVDEVTLKELREHIQLRVLALSEPPRSKQKDFAADELLSVLNRMSRALAQAPASHLSAKTEVKRLTDTNAQLVAALEKASAEIIRLAENVAKLRAEAVIAVHVMKSVKCDYSAGQLAAVIEETRA